MILFHLVHGLLILIILQVFLSAQVLVPLFKILNIEIFLTFDLLELPFILHLGLPQLQLHLALVNGQFIL
jgi:hypothetical protein